MDMGGRRWEEVGGARWGGGEGDGGGQRQGGMRCIMHIIFHEEQTVFCSLTLVTVAVDIPNTNVGKQGGEWGKQVESMNEESQVRGCYNFYYVNQETVQALPWIRCIGAYATAHTKKRPTSAGKEDAVGRASFNTSDN